MRLGIIIATGLLISLVLVKVGYYPVSGPTTLIQDIVFYGLLSVGYQFGGSIANLFLGEKV